MAAILSGAGGGGGVETLNEVLYTPTFLCPYKGNELPVG